MFQRFQIFQQDFWILPGILAVLSGILVLAARSWSWSAGPGSGCVQLCIAFLHT